MKRLTPRRLSWFGWFWGRVWFATKIAAAVALVAGLLVWGLAKGYAEQLGGWAHQRAVAATATMGLRVGDVIVEGRHHIDPQILKNVIGVQPGDPLMGVDIETLHARLTGIPWVRGVKVRRALPDRLIITLNERLPIALWRDAPGGPGIIDEEGVVLTQDRLDTYGQLLSVEGRGAEKQAGTLLALLKGQPDVAVRVARAVRVSERRWDLVMGSGTILRLPEDDPGFALARASRAQAQAKVLDQGLKAVDLRQPGRIILESKPVGEKPGDMRDLLLKDGNPV